MRLQVHGQRRGRDLRFQGVDGDRQESGEEREGSGWGAGRERRGARKERVVQVYVLHGVVWPWESQLSVFYVSGRPWEAQFDLFIMSGRPWDIQLYVFTCLGSLGKLNSMYFTCLGNPEELKYTYFTCPGTPDRRGLMS